MTDYGVVFMTASSHGEAENIAESLVSQKLAACVNILPNIKSFYWWKNKLCKDDELFLIAKIKNSNFKELEKAVKEIHSYDVPEVILLPIEEGSNTYLQWIEKVTT
jgi:periplasmic divalent cation tolerance protein